MRKSLLEGRWVLGADANRELLFGLVALKSGVIDEDRLVTAFQAWARDPSRTLAEHLLARRDLNPNNRDAITTLVARELVRHHGNAEECLTALPRNAALLEQLHALSNSALSTTIGHMHYNYACSLARKIPLSVASERAELAARAVEGLRQSIAAGYSDYEKMKVDPDLNALRKRVDFKALMTELASKQSNTRT